MARKHGALPKIPRRRGAPFRCAAAAKTQLTPFRGGAGQGHAIIVASRGRRRSAEREINITRRAFEKSRGLEASLNLICAQLPRSSSLSPLLCSPSDPDATSTRYALVTRCRANRRFANVATILFIREANHPRLRGVAMRRDQPRWEEMCVQFLSYFISDAGKLADSVLPAEKRIIQGVCEIVVQPTRG